ncbi:triose-phosphate isomerase [Rhodoglobus aureus]|uniref:Triosephosphate isomerase n=1 Tax=Rhodoglobus aureus TaxID=191497 RepID=A0ABN1VHF5_9MICO
MTLGASLKLYLDVDASVEWAEALKETARVHPLVISGHVRLFVLPSLPALSAVIDVLADSPIAVGAQDLFWEDRGAYTGGVSGADLARLGCTYVEVGHVERRRIFNEDDLTIRLKFAAALRNGLTPVLCVGEAEQIDAESAAQLCIAQLDSAMANTTGLRDLVVAYEPEWAIGQAEPAPSAHVVSVIRKLRQHIDEIGLVDAAVVYGGSAKPGLLSALGNRVDGLFLGRFAHDPAAFASIIDEAAGLR